MRQTFAILLRPIIATLLRRYLSATPCGYRLRCRYQNSGRVGASPATSLPLMVKGKAWLGIKGPLPLGRDRWGINLSLPKGFLSPTRGIEGVVKTIERKDSKKQYHHFTKTRILSFITLIIRLGRRKPFPVLITIYNCYDNRRIFPQVLDEKQGFS